LRCRRPQPLRLRRQPRNVAVARNPSAAPNHVDGQEEFVCERRPQSGRPQQIQIQRKLNKSNDWKNIFIGKLILASNTSSVSVNDTELILTSNRASVSK